MTLESENKKLKEAINGLQEELELYRKKDHVTSKLTDRLSITQYNDGIYTVSSKYSTKSFRIPSRVRFPGEFENVVKEASYQVKKNYTKDALEWIMEESSPIIYGNIKFYVDRNLPADTILMNPCLCASIRRFLINCGEDNTEEILRQIIEDRKGSKK